MPCRQLSKKILGCALGWALGPEMIGKSRDRGHSPNLIARVNGGAEPRLTSGGEAATTSGAKAATTSSGEAATISGAEAATTQAAKPCRRSVTDSKSINHPHPQTFICGIVVVLLNAETKKYVSARNVAPQMFVEQTTKQ